MSLLTIFYINKTTIDTIPETIMGVWKILYFIYLIFL